MEYFVCKIRSVGRTSKALALLDAQDRAHIVVDLESRTLIPETGTLIRLNMVPSSLIPHQQTHCWMRWCNAHVVGRPVGTEY